MEAMINREEAKRELARRELARRHLVNFSEYMAPWYRAQRHHRLVGDYLEQVELYIRSAGQNGIGRLLIFEPPRHGKTEQVSKHFPAWMLGKHPDMRIILASYGADLATSNSRAVRDLLLNDRYKPVFGDLSPVDTPVELSADSRSVAAWDLASPHRGGLVAAGVGGGITGKGAHLFIVDDPFKNREEAESEARRELVWEWWTSSAYTRLENGAAVIGMMTRWHGDDWAGRLLKLMAADPMADRYAVISLPAVWEAPIVPEGKTWDEFQRGQLLDGVWVEQKDLLDRREGEALWPQKYSAEDLARMRANIQEYDWFSLYQQSPFQRSGNMFQREWFNLVDGPPEKAVYRVRWWDKAGTKGGDYTASVLMSVDAAEVITVEHAIRGKWTPGERDRQMKRIAEEDAKRPGPVTQIWHQKDPASAGLDSALATNRLLVGYPVHFEDVSGDKVTVADPWSSHCQSGKVNLVRSSWNEPYISEHAAFPKGKNDDWVDCSGNGYKKLIGRSRGIYV